MFISISHSFQLLKQYSESLTCLSPCHHSSWAHWQSRHWVWLPDQSESADTKVAERDSNIGSEVKGWTGFRGQGSRISHSTICSFMHLTCLTLLLSKISAIMFSGSLGNDNALTKSRIHFSSLSKRSKDIPMTYLVTPQKVSKLYFYHPFHFIKGIGGCVCSLQLSINLF